MRFKRALAALTATGLAVAGLTFGGSAATAAPGAGTYLPVSGIPTAIDPADESAKYNSWHFDQGRGVAADAQQRNGFVVETNAQVLAKVGNGNDAAKADPEAHPDQTSIADLASSLDIELSDPSRAAYQIPVFYGHDGNDPGAWKFTTLRKNVAAGDNDWMSSSAIVGAESTIVANTPYPLGDILAALGDDARPIAAGFFVDRPTSAVLVSSFTANGETTRFYEEPVVTGLPAGPEVEFVHSDGIRADAATYQGWHEEVPITDPARGSFSSVLAADDVHFSGLQVTGKSQLIYGFDKDQRPRNSLEALIASYYVDGELAEGGTLHSQIPLFLWEEGVRDAQFTTLRAVVPESGDLSDADTWVSSRAVGSIPAGTPIPAADLLEQLSGYDYEILGFGFTVERGEALIRAAGVTGHHTTFSNVPADEEGEGGEDDGGDTPGGGGTPGDDTPGGGAGNAVDTATQKAVTIAKTGADPAQNHAALIAAIALMLLGGTVLGARALRRRAL